MSHPFATATRRRGAAALTALVALTGLALTAPPEAEAATVATHDRALQRSLEGLVRNPAVPAALASVRDKHGRVTNYTAGVADIRTRAKVPTDGYVRIASSTKMFTAVVVLQLAGEGRIELDESVETYLPGVVRGKDIDAEKITVRQLLQHTSGLQSNTFMDKGILPIRDRYFDARELLDSTLAQGPAFAPGTDWDYSNGGYVLLGLIAQKVAGRPFAELVTTRIINRLGLSETYYPGPGDRTIRQPHAKGYLPVDEDGKLLDITEFDPSIAGAAGQIIATPSDVNKFLVGLHTGKLLESRELAEMRKTVPTNLLPGWSYGLGLIKFDLSCGGTAYGHGGDADGYESRAAITTDGRAVTVVITNDQNAEATTMKLIEIFDAALCAKK
ncbi:serine hydrolase domain-containing protein [Actinoplanes auranticolor]|uniref:Serine hydrolase n=1 Tax=Actinoplanes auranticolor TaxID=47988 RepID=A0A919SR78_9ACTN|nr:serine hydrolase domain-containing protein [Actinoplanes auranticolor]GIM76084.1 serine hydrolase [Actinoplanes auranticolor]